MWFRASVKVDHPGRPDRLEYFGVTTRWSCVFRVDPQALTLKNVYNTTTLKKVTMTLQKWQPSSGHQSMTRSHQGFFEGRPGWSTLHVKLRGAGPHFRDFEIKIIQTYITRIPSCFNIIELNTFYCALETARIFPIGSCLPSTATIGTSSLSAIKCRRTSAGAKATTTTPAMCDWSAPCSSMPLSIGRIINAISRSMFCALAMGLFKNAVEWIGLSGRTEAKGGFVSLCTTSSIDKCFQFCF